MKVEITINRTKSVSKLCSINVLFDQYHVGKKLNKTLIKQNLDTNLVRLMLILTFYVLRKCLKTTYSSIVELNQKNYRRKNCQTSHLLRNKRPLIANSFILISNIAEN